MTYAPSEDTDQPGHPPSLIRVVVVRSMGSFEDTSFLHVDSEDWSDWADAQADLRFRWVHMPLCWFCHVVAQFSFDNKQPLRHHYSLIDAHSLSEILGNCYVRCLSIRKTCQRRIDSLLGSKVFYGPILSVHFCCSCFPHPTKFHNDTDLLSFFVHIQVHIAF